MIFSSATFFYFQLFFHVQLFEYFQLFKSFYFSPLLLTFFLCFQIKPCHSGERDFASTSNDFGYHLLIPNKIMCRSEDVKRTVQQTDPKCVKLRKRRDLYCRKNVSPGPYFVCHKDSKDK